MARIVKERRSCLGQKPRIVRLTFAIRIGVSSLLGGVELNVRSAMGKAVIACFLKLYISPYPETSCPTLPPRAFRRAATE